MREAKKKQNSTTLGLDYGSRRIGLALSDPDGVFAFPAGCLERKSPEQDLAALRELVEARGVVQIVVGLPIHMSGREGPEARAARAFAETLRRETGRSVELLDERWTSREAERALRDAGRWGKAAKQGRGAAAQPGEAERRAGPRSDRPRSEAKPSEAHWAESARPRSGRAARRSRAKPGEVDAAAATLLLRSWLERRARGAEGER
jgi:putative Holliday junction resolvase